MTPGTADQAAAHYQRGNALKDAGQAAAALDSYEQALALRPQYPQALCNRGVVLASLGRLEEALESYARALALAPADTITLYNRSGVLAALRRWDEALAGYEALVQLDPGAFHAHLQRGNVLRELRRWQESIAAYSAAIGAQPGFAVAHFNRGVVLLATGQVQAALADFEQAVALDPQLAQAHCNRGNALAALGRPAQALASYDTALALKGDYAEAWCNRGVALRSLQRPGEALASFERAVALRPAYAEGWFNRGALLHELGREEQALAALEQALQSRGDYAEAWFNRGATLLELRRYADALASFERALQIRPEMADAHYNRALTRLLLGDYAAGWPEYEWRWQTAQKQLLSDRAPLPQPLWLGREELRGRRVLLWHEQGLGDTLQFCRFATQVAALGATVILQVPATLVALLSGLAGVAEVVAVGAPLPPFERQCPLLSLPGALGTTLATIPPPAHPLRIEPALRARWAARLGTRRSPRIGIVWSGNAAQGNDRNRSIPLETLASGLPREFDYVCLQQLVREADRETLRTLPWIRSFAGEIGDFSDTAALALEMDLVISVCTSVLHLAGTLGTPAWALLAFNADWRWLVDREDSPWYPGMRLYRQGAPGDWAGVVARVAAALRDYFAPAAGAG